MDIGQLTNIFVYFSTLNLPPETLTYNESRKNLLDELK